MNRACLNRKQDLFRHLADKCRPQPLDVRRRFSKARDSFNRAQKDHSCTGNASSSGKGSSGGSTACTCRAARPGEVGLLVVSVPRTVCACWCWQIELLFLQ